MFDLDKIIYMHDDFKKEFLYKNPNNDGYFISQFQENHPIDVLKAIQRLKNIFEANNEKDKVNLTKSMIDNQMCVRNNEDCLDEMDKIEIRTKALELALKEISFPLHDDKGNMFYECCDRLANLANRFYKYITKGE